MLKPIHHKGDGRHSKSSSTSPWPDFKGPTRPRLKKPWTKHLEINKIVSYILEILVLVPRLCSSNFNDLFFLLFLSMASTHAPNHMMFPSSKTMWLVRAWAHTWVALYHSKAPFINLSTYFPYPYDNYVEDINKILEKKLCPKFWKLLSQHCNYNIQKYWHKMMFYFMASISAHYYFGILKRHEIAWGVYMRAWPLLWGLLYKNPLSKTWWGQYCSPTLEKEWKQILEM